MQDIAEDFEASLSSWEIAALKWSQAIYICVKRFDVALRIRIQDGRLRICAPNHKSHKMSEEDVLSHT